MAKKKLKPTTEFIVAITQLIRGGVDAETAAATQGVPPEVWAPWRERANTARSGIFKTLQHELMKAEAEAKAMLVMHARKNAEKSGTTAVKLLEMLQRAGSLSEGETKNSMTAMLANVQRLKGRDSRAWCLACSNGQHERCSGDGCYQDKCPCPCKTTQLKILQGGKSTADIIDLVPVRRALSPGDETETLNP